jgi:hypothetical protein
VILALLLAAAAPGAIDAERAFVNDAQAHGQWTAFRSFAAPDALMFVPQPVNAQAFLKDRKDPPASVYWWPGRSYTSCDGSVAVNTGPWVRGAGKNVGYFTTVWVRQKDGGWKWVYDGGDSLDQARAEGGDIKPTIASCKGKPASSNPWAATVKGGGHSTDQTLSWSWMVTTKGERHFIAELWNGVGYDTVIEDDIAAPAR